MKAIIPAAGVGTRLRPHTLVIPKVLINVGGKPILSHIIDKALESGIDDIAFIIGYKGNQIQEYVESNYSFKYRFYEQKEILGLAHAIGLAEEYLRDEPVFIVLGDTIFEADIESVFKGQYSSLGVREVEDPRRFGTVELDENGFAHTLVEKPVDPKSNLTLVGLYFLKNGKILKESINELIQRDYKTRDEYQITDALQILINRGEKVTTFHVDGWYDCGKPETILSTNRQLLQRMKQNYKVEGSLIRPPVYINAAAKVENSIIGPYTTIAKGSIIRNTILVNSIVGNESLVQDVCLKDSIIGDRAVISGSFKTLNVSDFSEITL
ncbi:nucleotidyl transferase [bacterium SM23_31]|nr:MAG: nucleotidyl transferase [bacterium SM23_31]